MKLLYTIGQFVKFLFSARNTRGHGVHSPYLFDFFQNVIHAKNPFYCFIKIEHLRGILIKNNNTLTINDFGALTSRTETIAEIAAKSLKKPRYAQMLFRAVHFTRSVNVLELGASLGLTTAYLASPQSSIRCVTMEGSSEIAEQARENFKILNINNIELIEGNIDVLLQPTLDTFFNKIDFAFIDANHRYEAVMRYFDAIVPHLSEDSVLVMDDLYWSKEMTQAWNKINSYPSVSCSINLFQMGFIFFNKNFPKKKYKALCIHN